MEPAGNTKPAGWRWVVMAGAAAGAYACVPETDHYLWLMLLLLGAEALEIFGVVVLPWTFVAAAWGLLALSAFHGATGRTSAYVGGAFSLIAPLAAAWAGRRDGWLGLCVGGVWVLTGVGVARTGGIATTGGSAWRAAVIGGVVATAISAVLWRLWRRSPRAG